uniref:Uncharacterized protein n=1 Tax=Tanacetum cinerariifolium TaxID=118510 RepID=A0A699KH29_TANCI|nr:hypothetical protein [Tanacetum cinerariifolium]
MERAATTAFSLEAKQDSVITSVLVMNRGMLLHIIEERVNVVRRQGHGFSGNVTPLFETMMVNAQEEVGEGSGLYTDSHYTPTDTQPSLSKSQKKIKPKRKQRQAAKVHSPNSEILVEEKKAKIAQAKEIAKLKKELRS